MRNCHEAILISELYKTLPLKLYLTFIFISLSWKSLFLSIEDRLKTWIWDHIVGSFECQSSHCGSHSADENMKEFKRELQDRRCRKWNEMKRHKERRAWQQQECQVHIKLTGEIFARGVQGRRKN